ncbi:MAG: HEAT repeat domain-containing protein [Ignavibacteria bacterium]|nr:HEAT repeat domain-containing protein [Ignavibacteria bacterium]
MNHSQYKEWLQLLLYNELNEDQRITLEKHLDSCSGCRTELEDLKKFHSVLVQHKSIEPSEQLLTEARQELRGALRIERSRRSFWERLFSDAFRPILPEYKVAFAGVATLALGMVIGYYAFSHDRSEQVILEQAPMADSFMDGDTRISNVRFIDSDASDGEIEFTFEASAPVRIKGSMNDGQVQRVLFHALLNEKNPGVRLHSLNAISTQALTVPDREVKAALILALTSDENPGVRKEALRVLQSFPFDSEIKQAFLHVLMRDDNSGLRIAAINSLDSALTEGRGADEELLKVLTEKMQSDKNNYIRTRATTFLREVKQQ